MKKHFSDLVPDTMYRDPTFCPLIWTTNTLTFVGGTLDCVAWLTLQWLQLGSRETRPVELEDTEILKINFCISVLSCGRQW